MTSFIINPHIKSYLKHLVALPSILEDLRAQTLKMPEAKMQIAPELAQTLAFMANIVKAKSILEIGTYTGFSSLYFALYTRANIVTCDHNFEWTKIARKFWKKAEMENRITLIMGKAVDSLNALIQEQKKFDFIFIDADKNNYPQYFEQALQLIHKGGIIAVDNTLWRGNVAREEIRDPITIKIRDLNQRISEDKNLESIVLPLDDGVSFIRIKN